MAKDVPPTVAELIQAKAAKAANWEKANPGLSWSDSTYSKSEAKVYLLREVLESEPFRSLSRVSILVYLDFLSKRIMMRVKRGRNKVWKVQNNGQIIFPCTEAEEKGISRTQFRNAIDELQQTGFIDITHQGKGGRKPAKGTGDVSTYMIDERWRDYGTPDFKPPRNPRRKDTRKGRGFSLLWNDPEHKEKLLDKQRVSRVKK